MPTPEVHTVHSEDSVHVEFVDGSLTILRWRGEGRTPRALLGAVAAALDAGREQHRQELAAVAEPLPEPAPDPDRDLVMAFAQRQLDDSPPAPPPQPGELFPSQTDGRDESGRAHVSLTMDHVMILEVSPDLLADERAAGLAVMEAYNLAAERLTEDLPAWAEARRDDDALADVNWSELAHDVRRLGGGH
ncbi:hypothetical protein [Parenemella sanctibonifatiensis]|uniref:Uncharacterized protein n=1 Tax=Parenemella sanctibonifatiensis TaxID=2016505 RepID=A0A255EM90_9ACTN|nr:hypothetical protein [Parenemella sanctibonifatiensis]OYN92658.1 hypothetical protein CGZ91_04085 [Parenemella sanctibonifatiensis]